ncbi:hypothetical protein COXBURSA331_A1710 [Coxiella burnetii RSA 331]|nr:hypothetical protein COXBURSA331_A1710 [Coxiella burnetii RSA 331]
MSAQKNPAASLAIDSLSKNQLCSQLKIFTAGKTPTAQN